MAEPDPHRMVHLWAHRMAEIEARVARPALVMAAAADADPEVAKVHEASEQGRRRGARVFVTRLKRIGGLRAGLTLPRATAVAVVLMEPLVYQRLVVESGWTVAEYATSLERAAAAELLSDP